MSDPKRIVTAEDDPDIQRAIMMLIRAAGFEVDSVSNGEQLVRHARTTSPDLILLDIRMPVMDGREALGILKDDPDTSDIPIIVLSASPGDRTFSLDTGASYFLSKPFDSQELIAAVRSCLEKTTDATLTSTTSTLSSI